MEETLKDKVSARLKDLDRNPFEAARRAGLERGFVNDILNGRKRSVRGENLVKLAIGLDCDPNYLIGRQETPKSSIQEGPGIVRILGDVAAGIWLDCGIEGWDNYTLEPSPFPPDGRFPTNAQFDLIVCGNSINRFARDGQRLRCVAYEAYPYPVLDDDIVVVERYRGDLRERTAKRWRKVNGVAELWPDSDDPRWQLPIKVDLESGFAEGDLIKIAGIVLYVYDIPRNFRNL